MNLPNKLTILRIILFFPLIILFSLYLLFVNNNVAGGYKIGGRIVLSCALLVFLAAMITDFFDGKIARKNNLVTSFGKLWDPLADKMIITSTLIAFAIFGFTPLWIVILFVARDLIVDGSRVVMAEQKIGLEASIWGKLKTFSQTVGLIIIFLIGTVINIPDYFAIHFNKKIFSYLCIYAINIPMFLALFFSLFSGYLYVKKIVPFLSLK